MSLFDLFKRKNPDSSAARKERILRLHGLAIRYVTERVEDNDNVVGRGGNISVRDGEFILFTSGDILFRAMTDDIDVSNLMSGDGIVITGPNTAEGGKVRSLTAHFVYYRK